MTPTQNLTSVRKKQPSNQSFLSLRSRLRELELLYNLAPKLSKSQIKQLQLQFERIVNEK